MNNIQIYKFLLPFSVLLIVVGAIIFFLGFFPVFGIGSNFGPTMETTFVLCLAFGFMLLAVSIIDSSLSHKRAAQSGQENVESQKIHKILKTIGIVVITIVVFSFLLITWIASGIRD